MPASLIDILLDGPFELTPRPEAIPGDLRRAWGIALVVLILGTSRGRRASLQKLHFLGHSARTSRARSEASQVFAGDREACDFFIRVEPWLNRALAFAKGGGLVELENGKAAKLTLSGEKFFERLLGDVDLFREEKAFLIGIRKQATEAAIERLMRMELPL